ncbi:hypothetical protein [Primorskyibacter flagellatus]|uniref:hypothetical protein n=1 Tax=Primorskyibacter flagellatus TaxID=1387277 RepID=UPI003A94A8AA
MTADFINALREALAEFARSDLGPVPAPDWHAMLSVQMAHMLVGASLALFRSPAPLVGIVFAVWAVKELLGDIPNGGSTWPVMADSMADLSFGALGYIIAKSRMEKPRHDLG